MKMSTIIIGIVSFFAILITLLLAKRHGKKDREENKCENCGYKNGYVAHSNSSFSSFMQAEATRDTLRRWEQEIAYYRKEIVDYQGQLKTLTDENTRLTKELKHWTGKEKVQFT